MKIAATNSQLMLHEVRASKTGQGKQTLSEWHNSCSSVLGRNYMRAGHTKRYEHSFSQDWHGNVENPEQNCTSLLLAMPHIPELFAFLMVKRKQWRMSTLNDENMQAESHNSSMLCFQHAGKILKLRCFQFMHQDKKNNACYTLGEKTYIYYNAL